MVFKGYVIKSKRLINYRGQIEREFPSHEDVQKMCFDVTKVKWQQQRVNSVFIN